MHLVLFLLAFSVIILLEIVLVLIGFDAFRTSAAQRLQ
jgi:hypothetical protein